MRIRVLTVLLRDESERRNPLRRFVEQFPDQKILGLVWVESRSDGTKWAVAEVVEGITA